ncbi:ADP-ribosylation factor-like protein 6-interacting protein 4 [Maniola jurtina]|uniref:ADP-ribosylation factor-like protein 6-interacting protein 4 n=1 Tax=Maniola jurtina TaxID=191418 RepID=UPI001E68C7B7|nr:ADP-ribosylation factor-like protein 6-interacting protein 4 [Maniola jurtina]XP_045767994.1 ADP-ribosylation factor-like protein 6-interacting protein 4 [Maniola jurtina]
MGKEKSKKRHRSESSSSSSSDSSREKKKLRKLKKKLKKEQKKTEKALKKKLKEEKKKLKKQKRDSKSGSCDADTNVASADIPLELMERSKAMAPMTKEEWEKRQSVVRKVHDEETGRYRLIKGDGEVLEEIVSYDRHREINRQATMADGDFFQSRTVDKHRVK